MGQYILWSRLHFIWSEKNVFLILFCYQYFIKLMDLLRVIYMAILNHIFVTPNSGCLFIWRAKVFLNGHDWKLFSMKFSHVVSDDVFWPSHILFKYFENVSITYRNACKGIYVIKLVFIVSLWWVILHWDVGTFAHD